MSYILDALKKSERERGHGGVPGVQTVHSSGLNYNNEKTTYWPYILITAVVLNLGAILYFIIDKDSDTEAHLSRTQSQNTNEVVPQTVAADDTAHLPAGNSIENEATQAPPQNSPAEPEAVVPPATVAVTEPARPVVKAKKNRANTNSIKETPVATKKEDITPYQDEVKDFHDLPQSTKQQLPAIVISAHVYSSNPLQRSIVINNNFLEEGEYVLDGLILHEITKDGAVLDYNGMLFHYGVVSSWQ